MISSPRLRNVTCVQSLMEVKYPSPFASVLFYLNYKRAGPCTGKSGTRLHQEVLSPFSSVLDVLLLQISHSESGPWDVPWQPWETCVPAEVMKCVCQLLALVGLPEGLSVFFARGCGWPLCSSHEVGWFPTHCSDLWLESFPQGRAVCRLRLFAQKLCSEPGTLWLDIVTGGRCVFWDAVLTHFGLVSLWIRCCENLSKNTV